MSNAPRSSREWLLSRQVSANADLDRLRARALRDLPDRTDKASGASLLHALFYPNRFAWSVIAAAWVALLLLHVTATRNARQSTSPKIPPAAIAAWLTDLKSHDVFAEVNHLD